MEEFRLAYRMHRGFSGRDEEGGSGVCAGDSRSSSLPGVHTGQVRICNMKLKGQLGQTEWQGEELQFPLYAVGLLRVWRWSMARLGLC